VKVIIHIFMVLILLWIAQIYYNICRVIIVQNIANFSDNVTYNNANYSDKTDKKMHMLTSILPLKCPSKGNEIIHRITLCDVMFGVWCAIFLSEALFHTDT
jgi:hypothetical protein